MGAIKIVLLETNDKKSPLYKFVKKNGYGVHHIALSVNDLEMHHKQIKDKDISFATSIIRRDDFSQVMINRSDESAIMIELIERGLEKTKLNDDNFDKILDELERENKY
jgi:methylmalonyl-CoA/ethylmalonyl-CoA epimerase